LLPDIESSWSRRSICWSICRRRCAFATHRSPNPRTGLGAGATFFGIVYRKLGGANRLGCGTGRFRRLPAVS
jgi:hypothetical protein